MSEMARLLLVGLVAAVVLWGDGGRMTEDGGRGGERWVRKGNVWSVWRTVSGSTFQVSGIGG